MHPGRIEPVHRLVQDQQLWVAEQARGHPEALAHAHRVRGDLVAGPVGQADSGQRWHDPLVRIATPRRGQQAEVLPPGQVGMEARLVDDRSNSSQSPAPLGGHGEPEQRIVPPSARVRPSKVRINVVLPAPFGPR